MKQLIRHILREHTREIWEGKKVTTDDFIKLAKKKFGNKFDYSKVDYKKALSKVKIICPVHGEFERTPSGFLGSEEGCPECGYDRRNKGQKDSTEKFVEKSKKIHGNKYDYSKVNYENAQTKVEIVCPKHGSFFMKPNNHISGKQGCPKCAFGGLTFNRSNTDEFIKKAKKIHGNKYDYSLVDYKTNNTPVKIICPVHGETLQMPSYHLSSEYGCPKCGGGEIKNTKEFIDKANIIHNNTYDYSKVDYVKSSLPITIICPLHGEFQQSPNAHISQKQGCPVCGNLKIGDKLRKNVEDFIEQASELHNGKYDYSLVDYKNTESKIKIICPKHGVFLQKASNHLHGQGCPKCNESKGEKFLANLFNKLNYEFEPQKRFEHCISRRQVKGKEMCYTLPFDFYLPNFNTSVEYDGRGHFEPVWGEENFQRTKYTDNLKTDFCKKNGIKLIRIPYTMKKEEIEPYILKELGIK